jgi:hypothetical protein
LRRRLASAVRTADVVAAGFEVEGGGLELVCDCTERLPGGRAGVSLDPGDVGVADAGLGEVALRELTLCSEPPEALTDRLHFASLYGEACCSVV